MRYLVTIVLVLILSTASAFCAEELRVVKVGISNQSFSSFEHKNASFFTNGNFLVVDMSGGQNYNPEKGAVVKVELVNNLFKVSADGKELIQRSFGPVVLTSDDLISIQGLKRKGLQATYVGQFELRMTKNLDTFNIINVLDVNNYLKGVVPNEMPVSFGLEALKAQAIAARNYVNRPQNPTSNYNICDSTACQVYFGANSYAPLADKAVEQTDGIFALYKYEPILALYSSTAGGITESHENAFGDGLAIGPKPYPYLKSVGGGPLKTEEEVKEYYSSMPKSPDMKSPLYRWKVEWTRAELEALLNKTLVAQSKAGLVEPRFEEGTTIDELQDIKVLRRGDSGKALLVEIIAKNGRWKVKKELGIRRVFQNGSKILYSANFYIEKTMPARKIDLRAFDVLRNADNTDEETPIIEAKTDSGLEKITFIGGGFGHGVGMSQYGAGYMAGEGKDYVDILKYYYQGTTISTLPKSLSNVTEKPSQTSFYFDKKMKKRVILKFDNTKKLSKLEFNVNEFNFAPNMLLYGNKILWFDITTYLKNGDNNITIMPLGERDKTKQASFWIELE